MTTAAPAYFDGGDYELMLTVDRTGHVQIQHQAGDDQHTDRILARLAAEIADEQQTGDVHIVRAPEPGAAVMACAECRQVVDSADLRWLPAGLGNRSQPRIGCPTCAERTHS